MLAEIVSGRQREAWNAYIDGNDKAIAWQVMEWNDLLQKHHPVDFYPVAILESGNIRGVLPLYLVKTLRGGKRLISVAYAVAGGIVADGPEEEKLLLEKAVALNEKLGATGLTLKQYKHPVTGALTTDDNYFNRELDLKSGADSIREGLAEENRRRIEESYERDFSLDREPGSTKEFYDLLLDHHRRRGVPCCSQAWIEDLVGSGMYETALLREKGRAVAGTMMKSFKKTVSFPFTCVARKDEGTFVPVYRLYWELIMTFAVEGYEIFHSGRIPNSEETDRYRLGWGGKKHGYFYQYHPPSTGATEFRSRRNRKRKVFEAAWKLAPRPLTRTLGPHVVRQFP